MFPGTGLGNTGGVLLGIVFELRGLFIHLQVFAAVGGFLAGGAFLLQAA